MRMTRLYKMALGPIFLACTLPAGLAAQTSSADTDKKIENLEKQLEAMRAELNELKAKPVASAAAAPAAAAPGAEALVTPAGAAPPPNPLAGITSVLAGVTLTGLVDAYYGYNANHPSLGIGHVGNTATEPFQFTNGQFSLNMLELQLDKPVDKTSPLGFRVALGFGQAINAVNNTSYEVIGTAKANAPVAQYLKEGYMSYMAPLGKGLQIDAGKFVTPAGAEVIETNQNWNYSRSLLFTYAIPYYHFGARAKYTFNDKWSVTGYVTNGWNNVVSTNTGKTFGPSITWNATKKITITENYLAGPRDIFGTGDNGAWNHLSDTVITYNPTAKLSLMANLDYDYQSEFGTAMTPSNKGADFTGIAAYAKYALTPNVAVAGRFEYLNDHDGLATFITSANGQHVNEFTGTLERKLAGHLISRLEFRHDDSNKNFFQKNNTYNAVKGQTTVDVGLVYVIEPSETK